MISFPLALCAVVKCECWGFDHISVTKVSSRFYGLQSLCLCFDPWVGRGSQRGLLMVCSARALHCCLIVSCIGSSTQAPAMAVPMGPVFTPHRKPSAYYCCACCGTRTFCGPNIRLHRIASPHACGAVGAKEVMLPDFLCPASFPLAVK